MKIRLVHVRRRKSGRVARREETHEDSRLTVGRGTDNVLDLAGLDVSLRHAVFFQAPDGVHVETLGTGRVLLNGGACTASRVRPGDVVRIGAWELRLVEPAEGEWIAVEIEAAQAATTELEELRGRTRRGVERGLFTRRKLSLAALAAVLGLGLALPLALERWPGEETPAPSALVKALRSSWSSGPLSAMHGNLAQDCSTCHRAAFERVSNETCLACHAGIGRHTRPALRMTALEEGRCAACHEEHGGNDSLLALDDALCVDCHRTLGSRFRTTTLLDVYGFTDGHPEFRPTVVTGAGTVERISLAELPVTGELPADSPRERSGLVFPHAKHLEPGLRGADSQPVTLVCADCHRPDRSGRLMEPIRFEDHCQSCHRLAFEELDPTREVPHEVPDLVVRHVFEYYAGAALRGNIEDRAAPAFTRRRPGSTLSESERERALEWARVRAAQANAYLFGEDRGLCRTCHELRDREPVPEVLPVRVLPEPGALSWMPLARFDHDPHRTMSCEGCHPARGSTSAGNVLLPGIDSCRECHGDVGAVREVPARCISCHAFHQSRHGAFDVAAPKGASE